MTTSSKRTSRQRLTSRRLRRNSVGRPIMGAPSGEVYLPHHTANLKLLKSVASKLKAAIKPKPVSIEFSDPLSSWVGKPDYEVSGRFDITLASGEVSTWYIRILGTPSGASGQIHPSFFRDKIETGELGSVDAVVAALVQGVAAYLRAPLKRNARTRQKAPPPEFPINPSNGTLDLRRLVPRTEDERRRMLAAVEVEHQNQLTMLHLAERGQGTRRGLLMKRLHTIWDAADRLRTRALKR